MMLFALKFLLGCKERLYGCHVIMVDAARYLSLGMLGMGAIPRGVVRWNLVLETVLAESIGGAILRQ